MLFFEDFQFNRDILKRSLPRTVENFIGRSKFVIFCDRSQKSNKKTFINVRHLIDNAAETLLNGPESPVYGRNQLQKLANGFGILNGEITIKMIETMSKEETADCWEYYIASTAKWLTYFDEFQKLPHCLQIKLTLSIWHVWGRLEKHAFTAVLRKQKLFTDKHLVVVGRNALINLKAFKYDHSWLSNYPPEQVEFFTGVKSLELYEVVDHLMSLEPTHIELTFMLAQLSFHYAASRFPEENEILKVTERFQQILSNDLHDYYVNDMNTPRYSVRMAQMMKINNLIQKYVREIRPRAELARTFEIFSIEFSHPEIFHDTGF
uniref:NR LBD domain-containing protein n=1 Tax=Caenorhabditis japonica TaxID=281687 RepID=A0A8R1DKP2_CAEJA